MEKLKSMVEFILEIDFMSTKDFCDKYGCPHPFISKDIKESADSFLQVDVVKHRLFVAHAKALNKESIANSHPGETIPHKETEATWCFNNLFKAGQLSDACNRDFIIRQVMYAINNQVKTFEDHLEIGANQFAQAVCNIHELENKNKDLMELIESYHRLFNIIQGEVKNTEAIDEWNGILNKYNKMLES